MPTCHYCHEELEDLDPMVALRIVRDGQIGAAAHLWCAETMIQRMPDQRIGRQKHLALTNLPVQEDVVDHGPETT